MALDILHGNIHRSQYVITEYAYPPDTDRRPYFTDLMKGYDNLYELR